MAGAVWRDQRIPENHPPRAASPRLQALYLGMLERCEGASGFTGWFDAGAIAGQFAACGQHLELLHAD